MLILTSLLQLAASVRLNCRFEVAEAEEFVGELYGCNVGAIHVDVPNMNLERVDGSHMERKSSSDVKGLFVINQILLYIPKGLGEAFKNLEVLHILSSELKVITKEDLQQFPNLKSLWVNDCDLQQLESGLLQFNPKLKEVRFQYNEISSIAADIFEPLKELEKADLGANSCISNRAYDRKQLDGLVRDILRNCQLESSSGVRQILPELLTILILTKFLRLFEISENL